MKAIEQMQAYIKQIRAADKAYYNAGNPMLTDYEYDQVFDALKTGRSNRLGFIGFAYAQG